MPRILQKKFYHCFPNFKCLPTILSFETQDNNEDYKTQQKTIKNFNSVFDVPSDSTTTSKSLTTTTSSSSSSSEVDNHSNIFSSFEDSDYSDNNNYPQSNKIPDFSNIFASQRFFVSSPGNSNSIVDFPANTHSPENPKEVVTGSVAVQTYSPDPYSDFRRSMQEMVEAHELKDVKDNWEFLHELLLCYLNLNTKHNHKYIIGAFSDLVVSLMSFEDSE